MKTQNIKTRAIALSTVLCCGFAINACGPQDKQSSPDKREMDQPSSASNQNDDGGTNDQNTTTVYAAGSMIGPDCNDFISGATNVYTVTDSADLPDVNLADAQCLSIGWPTENREQATAENCFSAEINNENLSEEEVEELWIKCGGDAPPNQSEQEYGNDVPEWDDCTRAENNLETEAQVEDEDQFVDEAQPEGPSQFEDGTQSEDGLEPDPIDSSGNARRCALDFIVPSGGYSAVPGGPLTVEWDISAYHGQEVAISLIENWVASTTQVVANTGVHQFTLPNNLDLSSTFHLSINSTTNGSIDYRCWAYTPLTANPNSTPPITGSFFERRCIVVKSLDHGLQTPNSCLPGASPGCTLADAIAYANDESLTPGRDRICLAAHLSPNPYGEYVIDQMLGTWPNGLPEITSKIWMYGQGAVIRVDSTILAARIFDVRDTGRLHLQRATLTDGFAFHRGGAIVNEGFLRLQKVTLENNGSSKKGGAIFNNGSLKLNQVTAEGNRSSFGGAIWSEGAKLTIGHSAFHNNQATGIQLARGGAVYLYEGNEIEVENSTFSGNSAVARGGALFFGGGVVTGTSVKLHQLTIVENTLSCSHWFACFPAGAGIATGGAPSIVHLANSIVSDNEWQGTSMNLSGNCLASHGGNIVDTPASSGALCSVQGMDNYGPITDLGQYSSAGVPGDGFHPVGVNSNAVKFGETSTCNSTDQLGNTRYGAPCDSGSVIAGYTF
jgi:hypothetical protein